MFDVSNGALRIAVIAGMAATAATVIFRFVAPFIGSRKRGETLAEHALRVDAEQREERLSQFNLNASPREALAIRLANFAILIAMMWLISRFPTSYFAVCFVLYTAFGMAYCAWAKVVPRERFDGLDKSNRLQLRLFYAWQWPIRAVYFALRRTRGSVRQRR